MKRKEFWSWQGLIEWLNHRFDVGYDTVIHVKGEERGGKSSFALNLFKTLNPDWKIRDGLFYDWNELRPLLSHAHTRFIAGERWWPFFWGDEATNILDTADWNKVENKAVRKLFRQWGYLRALTILIDPDGRLDKYIIAHRAKIRVIIEGRGRARVQLQCRDRDQEELPWYEDQFTWLYPDPAKKWPLDNAEYLSMKMGGMDVRLEETARIIQDAKEERRRSKLAREKELRELEREIENLPKKPQTSSIS